MASNSALMFFTFFDRLGLMADVLAVADSPPALLMLDALDGKELARIPTGASFRTRVQYLYIIVHHRDLHNVLPDASRPTEHLELVPNPQAIAFTDRARTVRV